MLGASCASHDNTPFYSPGEATFKQDARRKCRTNEQGRIDAAADLTKGRFHIYRYDLPFVRTGWWGEYLSLLNRYGVKENPGEGASIEYMKGYNETVDGALNEKFGIRYRLDRKRLFPRAEGSDRF